jgi:large subunit ribosomal protein L4
MTEEKDTTKKVTAKDVELKKTEKSFIQTLSADKDLKIKRERAVKPGAVTLWIHALLQNWRQGTVACKGRSDVSFSTKKPWKQKGTGRARAGSARSPLWRGGGVTFGPQPRTRSLRVTKKLRRRVLEELLWQLAEEKKLFVMDFVLEGEKPRTAQALKMLKSAGFDKVTVVVDVHDTLTQASFANLPNVQILFLDQLNAFNLAQDRPVIVLKKDVEAFKKMVAR